MAICKFITCANLDKLISPTKQGFFIGMKKYPEKILLAWGEAIGGNVEIRDWLLKEGYPELGLFCYALYFDKKSCEWLLKNCLLYTSPSPRDGLLSRMPSSA